MHIPFIFRQLSKTSPNTNNCKIRHISNLDEFIINKIFKENLTYVNVTICFLI